MIYNSRAGLDRALRERQLGPLYLFTGNETYLRDAAVSAVTEKALSGTLLREFNEASFSLLSDSVTEVISIAEQLPMMSERRLVRIRDFMKLREADEELLAKYVQNPAPSTIAIFVADELDKRRKLTKVLLDACEVYDFPPVKDGEAKAWAKKRLKELGTEADPQTLNQIVELVGCDLQTLNSELEKLSIAAINERRITGELIDALIGRSRELSNFDLGDQLVAGNRKLALQALHRLLADDVPPLLLLALIASNFRRLALARELLGSGGRAEAERLAPWAQRVSFMNAAQRISSEKLIEGLRKIAATDLALKTSIATPRLQLEVLISELAAG